MWIRSALAAMVLAPLSGQALAQPCERALEVPIVVQRGPTCAVAATVMAGRGVGAQLEQGELARVVPVWQDGVDFFDVEEALAARGLRSLTFRGDAALAAAFLGAGLPVVAAVRLHGGKHAVTLKGYSGAGRRCEPATVSTLVAVDPWLGRTETWDVATFSRLQAGRQLFVLWPQNAGWEAKLAAAGVALAPLEVENRRFRAEAWVLRAREHRTPNAQMVRLYERAVAEDPTWPEAKTWLEAARRAVANP